MTEDEKRERIAGYAKRVAAEAPPLTPDQRDRLALLLRPSAPERPHLADLRELHSTGGVA